MLSNNATTNSGFNFGVSTQATTFGSTPMFGATTSAPAAGGFGNSIFGATPTGGFGTTPSGGFGTSTFGAPAVTTQQQGFGGFGATTAFGSGPPAFGGVASTSLFGSTGAPTFGSAAPTFGSTGAPTFGAPTNTQASTMASTLFGNTSNSFKLGGATTLAPAFGASTAPAFGSTNNPNIFGVSTVATVAPTFSTATTTTALAFGISSGFGNTSVPNFGSNLNPTSTVPFGTGLTLGGSAFGTTVTTTGPTAFGAQTGFNFGTTTAATASFNGPGLSLTGQHSTANTAAPFSNIGATPAFGPTTTTAMSTTLGAGSLNFGMGPTQFKPTATTGTLLFNASTQPQNTFGGIQLLNQNSSTLGATSLGGFSLGSVPASTQPTTVGNFGNLAGPSSVGISGIAPVQSVGQSFFTKTPTVASTTPHGTTTLPTQFNFMSQSAAKNTTTATTTSIAVPSITAKTTTAATTAFTGFATTGLSAAAVATTIPAFNATSTKLANSQLSSLLSASTTGTKVTTPVTNLISILPTVASTPAATTTALNTALSQPEPPLTYSRLDELINIWNKELEENEKIFLDQTTRVNHWDRIISENGDKISQLNSEMERLSVDLSRLDQDLDFIVGQQAETENILRPIEEGLSQLPPVVYQQHTDLQREQIFKMAESLDVELKQVGMDLKEIVEHLNQSNDSQESADPVLQITKILNEHIDSMDWISRSKDILQKKTNDLSVQIENQKNKLPNLLSNKFNYRY